MAAFFEGLFTFAGRILLVAIFLGSAVNKIQNPEKTQEYMKSVGKLDQLYPESPHTIKVLYYGAVGFLVLGGVMVLFGFWARFGALLLLVFLGLATYYFHAFWNLPADTADMEKQNQMINFLKNCAIGGGLLQILARGAGRWSFDYKPTYY